MYMTTSLAEIYQRYAGVDCPRGCDKGTVHDYIAVYEKLLAPYRMMAQCVLEIGIMGGHSLLMWEEYFKQAEVYGVDLCDQPHGGLADLRPLLADDTHRISLFNAVDQTQVEAHFAGKLFDVVIDDASHAVNDQLTVYANFKTHLAPGGIYIIEDIEDIDRDRYLFEQIDPSRTVEIFDVRVSKGRFDDVLVVIR